MIIEVSKQFVMDALQQERLELLQPGNWIKEKQETKIEDCPRCAVGAVLFRVVRPLERTANMIERLALKNVGMDPTTPDMMYSQDELLELAESHLSTHPVRPLAALSFYFEGLHHLELDDDIVLKKVLDFINEHFPSKIKIDVNGYRPAEDVT